MKCVNAEGVNLSHIDRTKGALIVFFVLFVLRAIPEIISYPYPTGFDTLMYSTFYLDFKGMSLDAFIGRFFYPKPFLLDAVLYVIANTTSISPILFFKIFSVILYASFGLGIYLYAIRRITPDIKSAILISLLVGFYYSNLRISWELHRNMLSFFFLVLFLTYYPPKNHKETIYMSTALFLASISHQTSAVIIFLLMGTVLLTNLIFKRKERDVKLILLNLVILSLLFVLLLYYTGFFYRLMTPSEYPPLFIPQTNPKFVLDYPTQLIHTLSLFLLLLGPLLYLLKVEVPLSVALNSSIKKIMHTSYYAGDIIIFYWLLLISFTPLILRNFAPPYWYRWMLLAPFFLQIRIFKMMTKQNKFRITARAKNSIILIIFMSSTFIASPAYLPPPYFLSPTTIKYFPPTMLYNTVPLEDSPEVTQLMNWVNTRLNASACLLTLEVTYGWARLTIKNKSLIVYDEYNITRGLEKALARNFTQIYFIYWRNDLLKMLIFTKAVPPYFTENYHLERMAVYIYTRNSQSIQDFN